MPKTNTTMMKSILLLIFGILILSNFALGLTTCPRQCICHDHSIACSCEGAEKPELIISSLGSTYITSLVVHTCDKVTVVNGSFSGVILVERLSFIGIGRLYFEPHAFKDILQSPRQIVIDECNIPSLAPVSFAGLSHIEHLWFRNSQIEVIAMEAFHYLTNIDYIYFHKTKIDRIERRAFSKMYQINHLYFKQSIHIELVESEAFSQSQIEELVFDNAHISSAHDTFLLNILSKSTVINNSTVYLVSKNDNNIVDYGDDEEQHFIKKCSITQSTFNVISPFKLGCSVTEIENSKVSRIGEAHDIVDFENLPLPDSPMISKSLNSVLFKNCSIDAIDSFAFTNYSLSSLIFNQSVIGTIMSNAFKNTKLDEFILEDSKISSIEKSSFKKSKIGKLELNSMDINKIFSETFSNNTFGKLRIFNSKIDEIGQSMMQNSKIGNFELDGSRIHKLEATAFHGKNQIRSFSITESDLSTTPSSSATSILSPYPSNHPIHVILANNTFDCQPTQCSTNSFLLNSPKHHPLLWQVSGNKCRPPISNPCVSPRQVQLEEEYGISCRVSWQVAECVCTGPGAMLPFSKNVFGGDISVVIIGDCERLTIGKPISRSNDIDDERNRVSDHLRGSTSTITQLYIFRTSKCDLNQLPRSLKVLKIFHSTVEFKGQLGYANSNPTAQFWQISHSTVESIGKHSLSNLHLSDLQIQHCRIPYIPSGATKNTNIHNLYIESSYLESTQSLFLVSKTLQMNNSFVFSTPRGLGTISSAQLQNNTLLECCRHPLFNLRPTIGLDLGLVTMEDDIDLRCEKYFHGSHCHSHYNYDVTRDHLAMKGGSPMRFGVNYLVIVCIYFRLYD